MELTTTQRDAAPCFPSRVLAECFGCPRYRAGAGFGFEQKIDASTLAKAKGCPMKLADEARARVLEPHHA